VKAWRLRFHLALAFVGVTGVALILALALALPGGGGVSAVATCSTTLAQAASAGASSIVVANPTGCDMGEKIVLNQGENNEECQGIERVAPFGANMLYLVGTLAYDHSQGETVVEVTVCPTATATPTPTPTPTPAPAVSPTPTPTPTPTPAPAHMVRNCPQAGKWAIAWWDGPDTDAKEGLDTCGEGAVDAAYALDPSSGEWLRRFRDRPEISNLSTFENMQGFFAFGSSTASPTAAVEPVPPEPGQMYNCPLPGEWALAAWQGADTDASEALATCGEEVVDFAYALDPDSQMWLRHFSGHPEFSNKATVQANEGLILHGMATAAVSRIAFASDRDGDFEIYVMNADGSGQTQLTHNTAFDAYPAWSPDGSKIAFVSERDGNNRMEIYVMNADGTGQHNLTNTPVLWLNSEPDWSPDGTKIAYAEADPMHDSWELFVMNADGTGQTQLTDFYPTDGSPTWSPDGTKIAFSSVKGNGYGTIYSIDAEPGGPLGEMIGLTKLSNPDPYVEWEDRDPSWAPDGSKIAFGENQGGLGIFVMNADGSGKARLSGYPSSDSDPSWSPGGSKIVFMSDRDGNYEIYVMNADGTGQHNLTNDGDYDRDPAWAP
jgi:TolB protein